MDLSAITRAAHGYAAAGRAQEPDSMMSTAGRAAADFHATLKAADDTAMSAMTGDAAPERLAAALTEARLAVDTAVAVRDKVVEAYQEILRMPV